MGRVVAYVLLAGSLSGCAALSPFFGDLFQRAVSAPGGISAGRSSNPNVHCQTGPDGRTDCVEYRTSAPLRSGAPAPLGAEPYASTGPNANASAVPATTPLLVPVPTNGAPQATPPGQTHTDASPDPPWQAPLAPAPQPLPLLPPP